MTHDTHHSEPEDEQIRALLHIARQNQAHANLAIAFAGTALVAARYDLVVTMLGAVLAFYGLSLGLAPFSERMRRILGVFPGDVPKPIDRDLVERAADGLAWQSARADGGYYQRLQDGEWVEYDP